LPLLKFQPSYFLGIAILDKPFIRARSLLNCNVIKLAELHWLPTPQCSTAQCCRGLLPHATTALLCGTVNFRVHKNLEAYVWNALNRALLSLCMLMTTGHVA